VTSRRIGLALGGLAVATLLALVGPTVGTWFRADRAGPPGSAEAPSAAAYVEDQACAACHPAEARAWAGSYHDRAMQPAAEGTVLGDFGDVRFTDAGSVVRFFRQAGRFRIETEGPDGTPGTFPVPYTFGVAPLQQYLVDLGGGRLQALTVAWDTTRARWFSLYPGERFAPDHPLHWTGRYQRWNAMCGECHTTGYRKGYDLASDTYRTTWRQLGVGCQACHGPGRAHVTWAQDGGTGRAAVAGHRGLAAPLTGGDARAEVDACAACHSRRARLDDADPAGRPFLDAFRPELLRPGFYHPDGQQLGEVYEYGSFRQSRMYERGVRCSDCHEPHRLTLRASGDALCTRCHQARPDPRFPTLVGKIYDAPAHHHHPVASSGARCVACHMPARTYMVLDPRRDHSFRVPRPDLTVRLGTPDVCTGCHATRPAGWAAAVVARWRGPDRPLPPHYAEALAAGRARAPDAATGLSAVARDAGQPAIVRATALDLLRGYGPAGRPALVAGTTDPDALVRLAAVGALDGLPPEERLAPAGPLLGDARRAVRIEAARVLAAVPRERLDAGQRAALETALAEFRAAQVALGDLPGSHLNLAVVHEARGEPEAAEGAYQTALRLDPTFVPARINLARLLDAAGRTADAEQVLRVGIGATPDDADLHVSLGLLLGQTGRLAEAAGALAEAARLRPESGRIRYNLGLALEQLGRRRPAEAALLAAHRLDPAEPQYVYALALFFRRERDWPRALAYAEQLRDLVPGEAGPRELIERIRREATSPR
jgi:predicted CXXCH cytochrome family protein